jgi:hypothetical protein
MVYDPRRRLLLKAYDAYVKTPSFPGASMDVDILPHVADVAQFPPFNSIIMSPEGTTVTIESFQAAFEHLSSLAQKWAEDTKAQLSSLVVIPAELMDMTSPPFEEPADRLKLASAVFMSRHGLVIYPEFLFEIFYISNFDIRWSSVFRAKPWSLIGDHGLQVVYQFFPAACVVHACGLNPQTATRSDMDRRNARLICNHCDDPNPIVYTWKTAVSTLRRLSSSK